MNSSPLQIRAYRASDEDATVALWQACGLTRPWNDPHKDIARKLEVQPELFLVGQIDQQLVATVMGGYEGHRGWINYLAVHPDFQRRGLASALLRGVEQRLQAMGCAKINLQVRNSNLDVLAFYRQLGYLPDEVVCCGKRLIDDTPTAGGPGDSADRAVSPKQHPAGKSVT